MEKAIKYNLVDMSGKVKGSVDLDPQIFAADVDPAIVHTIVKWQLAKRRSGTHATINLAKMDNNKKKPYKQKGTGRSRCGSRYSPIRVGGAVAHGPQPRDYGYSLNKKVKSQALSAALTDKCQSETMYVVDGLKLAEPKTKVMAEALKRFNQELPGKKALVLVSDQDQELQRAGKNIPGVKFLNVNGVNVYDLVNADYLIFDKTQLEAIQARFIKTEEE